MGIFKDAGLPVAYVQYFVAITNLLFISGVIISVSIKILFITCL